jgi:hypothetical protein
MGTSFLGEDEICCPKCGRIFLPQDYFELKPGDEVECINESCKAVIVVDTIDAVPCFYGHLKEAEKGGEA